MSTVRERHAGEHWCTGSAGEAIYDPGTPCDAIAAEERADAERRARDAWEARAHKWHRIANSASADAIQLYAALLLVKQWRMSGATDAPIPMATIQHAMRLHEEATAQHPHWDKPPTTTPTEKRWGVS